MITLPKIENPKGHLSVIENDVIPFEMKRVYYLYDVPSGAERGGHTHKDQLGFLIALSGSIDVVLNDGNDKKKITLNRSNIGLLIPTGISGNCIIFLQILFISFWLPQLLIKMITFGILMNLCYLKTEFANPKFAKIVFKSISRVSKKEGSLSNNLFLGIIYLSLSVCKVS